MESKIKRSFASKLFLILGLVLALSFSTGAVISVFAEALVIDRTRVSFVEQSGGHSFRYYYIKDDPDGGVAVAWVNNYVVEEVSGATSESMSKIAEPSTGTIRVPALTNNSLPVKAVAPTGFRYCDFTEIFLPESITKIGREAFYSCQNLTKFVIPHSVMEIAPSTFMDCRNLTHVYYSKNASGADSYYETGSANGYDIPENGAVTNLTTIGDHAFTSCVKLETFAFPDTLISVGASAFQNCQLLNILIFPKLSAHSAVNITIGEYAFSDCSSFSLFFFETNVKSIGAYAFAKCEKLLLYYTGTAEPATGTNKFDANWRKKHVATDKTNLDADYVPIRTNVSTLTLDENNPGLYFITDTKDIMFDGWNGMGTRQKVYTVSSGEKYARIMRFITPTSTTTNYNATTQVLTIPDTVKDSNNTIYTVKVIDQQAFINNTDLKGVKLNANLYQICRYAFYGCSNLESIDFSACNKLREISYKVFQDENIAPNTKVTSIALPKCLEFICAQAFYGFHSVNSLTIPSNSILKWIGQKAFAYLGAGLSGDGEVDLFLPKSLNDNASNTWKPYRLSGYKNENDDNDNAVMREAFLGAKALRTVRMEWNTDIDSKTTHSAKKPFRIAFGAFCFKDCTSLIRFTASSSIYLMSVGMFQGCSSLKELFLSVHGASTSTYTAYTFGSVAHGAGWGGPIFDSGTSPDLVIYIKESSDPVPDQTKFPGIYNGDPQANGDLWNTNWTIANDYGVPPGKNWHVTPAYPTYYNVAWCTSGTYNYDAVKYIALDEENNAYPEYNINTVLPANNDGFSKDIISYISDPDAAGKFIITGSYCTQDRATVDLSGCCSNENFETIGTSAFAYGSGGTPVAGTTKIVLPPGIKKIGPFAFCRDSSRRIKKITYKSSGVEVSPSGSYSSKPYCMLPSTLTRIEEYAFYNHNFEYVGIEGNLAFFGNGAFGGYRKTLSSVDSLVLGSTQSQFTLSNKCLYYNGSGQRALLYSYDNSTTTALDLRSDSNLKAIGPHAFAHTKYGEVKFPSSLTTIYGGAFLENQYIQKIDIPQDAGLKYIGHTLYSPDGTAWNSSLPFNAADSINYTMGSFNTYRSSYGAFHGCTNLTDFNFRNLKSSLRKIGFSAFCNCSNLVNFSGGESKKFYGITATTSGGKTTINYSYNETETAVLNSGVLDLSDFTNLYDVGTDAFKDCSKLLFTHLPPNTSLHLGWDPEYGRDFAYARKSKAFPTGKLLVGEKYAVAAANGSSYDAERYPSDTTLANTYYFATYKEDLATNDTNALYWTGWPLNNPDGVILMNYTKANVLLPSRP